MIKPNTFIVGSQKSATTSLYNWIAQHPDICGPGSLKDHPFFIKQEYYEKGIESLYKTYLNEGYSDQKIIMQGSVQYMFFEKAIDRIFNFNPKAKLILSIRNPVDRAVSAYKFFRKLNLEPLKFSEALIKEDERLKGDLATISNLTYYSHGLYGKQLSYIYNKFDESQVLVVFYDDIKNSPNKVIKEAYKFLNVEPNFTPDFTIHNKTGKSRYQTLQSIVFGKGKIRKFIVDNFVNYFIPLSKRTQIKLAFKEWNTVEEVQNDLDDFVEERELLRVRFIEDIELLERLLGVNLKQWKKNKL
ncbi:sulfotransferase [uncultured Winogradskyella sp.]|uniref:sulfotransferase family protein n=1 Tax=uncultured Winogradskyella sp. TaxID=395353 RepID=UPI00263999C1|nr:sulfotransferase [uncultured Winogradskyella sp.]